MSSNHPKALIADDEPLLVQALENELAIAWPELLITDRTGDGTTTISCLLTGEHDIAFLDIQMPMESGIEVVQAITEEWSSSLDARPPPLFVFVTAYDQFAIQAFELAAIDYIVKPVTAERLKTTVERLKQNWSSRQSETALVQLVEQVNGYAVERQNALPKSDYLSVIKAGIGDTVHLIPIQEIIMFEASDKYVVVHTEQHQALIREPLRKLSPRLDPKLFKQIHRSTIVNLDFVLAAFRVDGTKMQLKMKGCDKTPMVSRLYRHLFKAM
jgi:DNA-binding LytR/AlgR family response regulator